MHEQQEEGVPNIEEELGGREQLLPEVAESSPVVESVIGQSVISSEDDTEQKIAELVAIISTAVEHPEENKEGLSDEEHAAVLASFIELRDSLEEGRVSEKTRSFIENAEVMAVIAGLKPLSYLQPIMQEKKFGLFTKREGLEKKDVTDITELLHRHGVEFKRLSKREDRYRTALNGVGLFHVYNPKRCMEVIRNSGLFSEAEIQAAEDDIATFLEEGMDLSTKGPAGTYRIGALLGYPLSDVKQFIANETGAPITREGRVENLSNAGAAEIKGVRGMIGWKSYDTEHPDVRSFTKKTKEAFTIQREVFGK